MKDPQVRDALLEYVADSLTRAFEYHDHKEKMAWSGTAATLGILGLSHVMAPILGTPVARFCASISIVVLVFLAYVFVHMQFEGRWKAADEVAVLRRARLRVITQELLPEDLVLSAAGKAEDHSTQFPAFIAAELGKVENNRSESYAAAAQEARANGLDLRLHVISRRVRSEIASYGSMSLIGALAVARLWV
jgi:hypothetical protein